MNNSKETPNSVDIEKLKDFNNFYDNLPGGRYRDVKYYSGHKKLIADLDKTAESLEIDTQSIFNEMDRANEKIMEALKALRIGGDTPEVRKIYAEGDIIRQEAHKKLIPLFRAMVKLGYTIDELKT